MNGVKYKIKPLEPVALLYFLSVEKIEKINSSILLLSATKDEIIPAVEMGEKMILRLKNNGFKYPYEHITFEC